MKDPFAAHNARVAKLNAEAREQLRLRPPSSVVVPEGRHDLAETAELYNAYMAAAKECLEDILGECMQPGGPARVEFGADSWSNIRPNDRHDIATSRYIDPKISFITKIG